MIDLSQIPEGWSLFVIFKNDAHPRSKVMFAWTCTIVHCETWTLVTVHSTHAQYAVDLCVSKARSSGL